jgi:hypothetical protein
MSHPIADRLAIQDVMTRYANGVDTRDKDLYASAFVEDLRISGGFGTGPEVQGREAWVAWVWRQLERFGPTQHLMGNYVVELRGDQATMRTYVQATHIMADDPKTTLTLWATYHDELVRDGDIWRITDHRLEPHARQVVTGT